MHRERHSQCQHAVMSMMSCVYCHDADDVMCGRSVVKVQHRVHVDYTISRYRSCIRRPCDIATPTCWVKSRTNACLTRALLAGTDRIHSMHTLRPSRETSKGRLSLATGNITLRSTLHIMSKCCAWTESGPKNVPGPNRSNVGPARSGPIPGTGPTRRLLVTASKRR